ncbi:MAG TPA: DUF167 domain-containing protein [Candidatus Binataceae bacterium]|nr:DUF167 domain-containing protein [Candidatus Binataceae bacterium]
MTVQVSARPGAGRQRIVRADHRGLVVALNSPPERGKANEELIDFLAGLIGVPRSALAIVRGASARLKLVQIVTAAPETVADRIRGLAERVEAK